MFRSLKILLSSLLAFLALALPAFSQDDEVPLFLETSLDRHSVYVGEPVYWKCCLWRSIPLADNPTYIPPATSGFMNLPVPQNYVNKVINGRQFVGNELSMHLIPQVAGNISVGGVQVRIPRSYIDVMALVQYPDFFKGLFKNTTEFKGVNADEALLVSPPIEVQVKPLPRADQPACFSGAVGKFTATAQLDRRELRADEPLTLNLTVKGQGNIALIEPPAGASFKGFRLLQQRAKGGFTPFALVGKDARLAGTALIHMAKPEGERTFSYVLMAAKPGDLQVVPPLFAYFDPAAQRYVTLENPPLSVHVLPALNANPLPLGPQVVTVDQVGGGWCERRLPGWFAVFLVAPLLSVALLRLRPKRRRWTVGYMRKFLRRGHTLSELWQAWCQEHFPGELSHAELEAALAARGAASEQLIRWRAFIQRLDAQRFGGDISANATGDASASSTGAISASATATISATILEDQDSTVFVQVLAAWDALLERDKSLAQLPLDRFDQDLPANYGAGWRWFWRHRLAVALILCLLASLSMVGISCWWGRCDAQSVPASQRAQQAFWHGDLVGAERAIQEAYDRNGRGAWRDYNLGCLAWQRGQYLQAHYLFSRACWAAGGRNAEYEQAWRDSAAKLKLNSWDPPQRSALVMPCWLWGTASFIAMCFWVWKRPRLLAFTSALALGGALWLALSWWQPSVVMVNGEGSLHAGPGYRFPALAPVRNGALAAVREEKSGYVRLQTVVGQDEFYEADDVLPEVWLPIAGVAYLE